MAGSWFRLDADYLEDARIWDAGWEAALLWPAVLSLLKQNDGVLDERTFSGRYLSRKIGCPTKLADKGVKAIREVGLLVQGTASWKVHQGLDRERSGWLSLRWAEKGNASSSWRILAQPSATLKEDSPTLPNDSRARCPVSSVLSGSVSSQSPDQTREPRFDIVEVYAAFRAVKPTSQKSPTDGRRKDLRTLLDSHGVPVADLVLMLEWAANAPDYEHQRNGGFLRWSTLLGKDGRSKLADRIEAAKEWDSKGRPKTNVKGSPTHQARMGTNWDHLPEITEL